MKHFLLAVLGLAWSAALAAAAPVPLRTATIDAINSTIARSGAEVAVAFRTLDGKTEWLLNADEPFHAASTMKVPVLIELYSQVKEGKVRLEDPLLIKNEFHSLADGSLYVLNPVDDSETELYKAMGQTRTLAQLSEIMITVSSNLAANLLIQKLGVENIRARVHALDADGMNVRRGLEDGKAFERGINNTTSARGLFQLMDAIAHGRAVDAESSQRMIAVLERQQFNEGIPAGLPAGTPIAHKTGEITKVQHDAAIVFTGTPFVLVVLTRGLADSKDSSTLIATITRQLYEGIH